MKPTGLEQYLVADVAHMRELITQDDIDQFIPRDRRQQLFWNIKNGLCGTYRGPWGNEPIYWDGTNPAFVEATHERSIEIRDWINDRLFGEHNL